MNDIVYLHGLKCECNIGIWAWEKNITQTLTLDIDLATNITHAAQNDDLNDAVDYQAVAKRLQEVAAKSKFELIESLIEKLAEVILAEFDTTWVRIKLDKGQAVKGVSNVGVIIERKSN